MRILIYSRVFPPALGGMERFAEDLAGWLSANGHEITVLTQTRDPESLDHNRHYRVLRRADSTAVIKQVRKADVVLVNGLSLRGIANSFIGGRPRVVVHAGHQAVCPTGLAWSPSGFCAVRASSGPCFTCPGKGIEGALRVRAHRLGAHMAATNICVSDYLQDRLQVPRSLRIYNPVSNERFGLSKTGSEDGNLIAFAGRLVEEKGLDLLLRAMTFLPDAQLEIAGQGSKGYELVRLAEDLGLCDRVKFRGRLRDLELEELWARASLVCLPSVWNEPFGYSCAESMAAGTPVVATPSGAAKELLAQGRGFLADDMTPNSLAKALEMAFADGTARKEAARRARSFAKEEFAIDVIGPKYVAVCADALA